MFGYVPGYYMVPEILEKDTQGEYQKSDGIFYLLLLGLGVAKSNVFFSNAWYPLVLGTPVCFFGCA